MSNQSAFGFGNHQTIVNTSLVVDKEYLDKLLGLPNHPSDLNAVIVCLYDEMEKSVANHQNLTLPPGIEEKIEFNNVLTYRDAIKQLYSESAFAIDMAYNALDSNVPGRRRIFMRFINIQYSMILGEHIRESGGEEKIQVIRSNADSILTKLIHVLLLRIAANSQGLSNISSESIHLAIMQIVFHAFVDCKVLENPNQ